jgi:hypothetical protein
MPGNTGCVCGVNPEPNQIISGASPVLVKVVDLAAGWLHGVDPSRTEPEPTPRTQNQPESRERMAPRYKCLHF